MLHSYGVEQSSLHNLAAFNCSNYFILKLFHIIVCSANRGMYVNTLLLHKHIIVCSLLRDMVVAEVSMEDVDNIGAEKLKELNNIFSTFDNDGSGKSEYTD